MPKDYDHDWRHKDDEFPIIIHHCDCWCKCPLSAMLDDPLCGYCADGHHYDESTPL